MSTALRKWLDSGRYLPAFLRDFHAQKDVFKTIGGNDTAGFEVTWVTAHVYVIDRFLWHMARCGWTLQRTRAAHDFDDMSAEIAARKEREADSLRLFLRSQAADPSNTGGGR